jgi:hypothetical protein
VSVEERIWNTIEAAIAESGEGPVLRPKPEPRLIPAAEDIYIRVSLWVDDNGVEEEVAYLDIAEFRNIEDWPSPIAYWYGLVDLRDPLKEVYLGHHFHNHGDADPVPTHHYHEKLNNKPVRRELSAPIELRDAIVDLLFRFRTRFA